MSELKEQAKEAVTLSADEQLEQMMAAGKKKKNRNRAIIALVLVAAFGWFIIKPMFTAKKTVNTGYINYPTEKRDITVSIGGSGAILPADSYNILGMVQGDVLSANFEEGDYVNKDDLLFQIDSSDAEKSIEQAQISLQNAGISYNNVVDSIDGLSPKSTVNGRVTKLYVRKGDEVSAGSPIAEISDTDNMVLTANFHASNASAITVGMQAQVTMTDTGEIVFGTVTYVSGTTTVGAGGVLVSTVEITVPNPGGIKGGASATAVVNGFSCAQSGTFAPKTSSTVVAKATGTINALHVNEGDKVTKDQALVTIDSDTASRQLESAGLSVRSAEIALENSLDILDNYSIKAPISGTIVEKNYKAGDTLDSTNTSKVMAVIYDMSHLTLTINVDELDISSVKVGQKVTIQADAVAGKVYEGYVERVGVNGTVASGVTTYPVKIIIENYEGLLPGMNVSAEIIIEQVTDVLSIPISAVSRGNTVLVVDPESTGDTEKGVPAGYRMVEVVLGKSDDDYIEVVEGLSPDDEVAVNTATTSIMEQMMGMGGGGGATTVVTVD